MTAHHLDPDPHTTIDYFSRDTPAVLTVDPGDTVIVRSLDASGFLERQEVPANDVWGVHALLPTGAISRHTVQERRPG